jgi:hypothetical protein
MIPLGSKDWHVELTFAPTILLIRAVHQFVAEFYGKVLGGEITEMVAIAVHELLENARKYSDESTATLNVELQADPTGLRLVIQMRNQSGEQHIQPLRALLESMSAHPDPMEHYVALMRETAKRAEGSGLGLARVRAEAGMDLDLELEGRQVCITAQRNIDRRTDA